MSAEGDCLSKAYAEAFLKILTLAKEVCGIWREKIRAACWPEKWGNPGLNEGLREGSPVDGGCDSDPLAALTGKGFGGQTRRDWERTQDSQRVLVDLHWRTWERPKAWKSSGGSRAGWAETRKCEVGLGAALSTGGGGSTAWGRGRGSSWWPCP